MSMFWRLAMIWLLALALPVQASAAQAMLLCGPAHQHPMTPTPPEAAQGHEQHEHHAHHANDDAVGDEDSLQHTCSACASCCNAPALAPTLARLDLPGARPEGVATLALAHERLLTGGLERPPRPLSLP